MQLVVLDTLFDIFSGAREVDIISPGQMAMFGRFMAAHLKEAPAGIDPDDLEQLRGLAGDLIGEAHPE